MVLRGFEAGGNMKMNTSERGLERLICTALTGAPCDSNTQYKDAVHEPEIRYGRSRWICGTSHHYDRYPQSRQTREGNADCSGSI